MKAFTLVALIGVLLSSSANATLITIDPDDYGAGTDLSNVSPYVSLSNGAHEAIRAGQFSCGDYSAPTGSLVFGLNGGGSCHGWASQAGGPFPGSGADGFVASFTEGVSSVRLLALNHGYGLRFAAEYSAYDENFQLIMHDTINAPLGELINIVVNATNIRYLDVGGIDSIGALSLDHLSFTIPEPGTLALALIGLAGIILTRRRGGSWRKLTDSI